MKTIQIFTDLNPSKYIQLWVAPLWERGYVAFFLNFFPSGIFLPEERAMSSFHGLQLLLYLANFKVSTEKKSALL